MKILDFEEWKPYIRRTMQNSLYGMDPDPTTLLKRNALINGEFEKYVNHDIASTTNALKMLAEQFDKDEIKKSVTEAYVNFRWLNRDLTDEEKKKAKIVDELDSRIFARSFLGKWPNLDKPIDYVLANRPLFDKHMSIDFEERANKIYAADKELLERCMSNRIKALKEKEEMEKRCCITCKYYEMVTTRCAGCKGFCGYPHWEPRNAVTPKATIEVDMSVAIEDVIYNPPATIVFWNDGTKTVVKAANEEYDAEKGLAMAISKKMLGNKYEYYNTFKHWLKRAPGYKKTKE